MRSDEILIKNKKEALEILYKQHAELCLQKVTTLNNADKPSIDAKISDIEKEIEEAEKNIDKLRSSSENIDDSVKYKYHILEWKEKLPNIDFKVSKNIINDILLSFGNNEAEEAIFLLQRSQTMAGDLLINELKSRLQNIGILNAPKKFSFLPYEQTNSWSFLKDLAKKLDVISSDNFETDTKNVIDKICNSLRSGNIFFVQIDIYSLNEEDDFLDFFVKFWCKLVASVIDLRNDYPLIKLVAVIAVVLAYIAC